MILTHSFRSAAAFITPFTQYAHFMQLTLIRQMTTGKSAVFIGLGNMGAPMALNLAKGGYRVHVFDKSEKQSERILSHAKAQNIQNVIRETSIEKLMHGQPNFVITMLPSSPQAVEVYGQQSTGGGLIHLAHPNTLFIDCTTGDPQVAKSISSYAASRNCVYIDAPVSGGVLAAQQGNLTFMVGGSQEAVDCATPVLKTMGKRIFHCGSIGTGLAAKICNNMLLAISMIGVSEAMQLGKRLGLDPRVLADVINNSSGRCWSSELYNPVPGILPNVPASNDYRGGFGTALMTKDLGLAQDASTTTRTPIPLGSVAHQLYRLLCHRGYAEKDFSSVYQFLSQKEHM